AFDPNDHVARNRASFGRTGDLGSLRATFTADHAVPIEQAIEAKADELFHRFTEDHRVDPAIAIPPRATLRALALAELIRGGQAVDLRSTRPPRTEAMIIVRPGADDPDVRVDRSWMATDPDGHRVPFRLLDTLLCDTTAHSLWVDGDDNPLFLGRTQR